MAFKNLENVLKLTVVIQQSVELMRAEASAALHDCVTENAFQSVRRLIDFCDEHKKLMNKLTGDITEIESVLCEAAGDFFDPTPERPPRVQGVGMRPLPVKVVINEKGVNNGN